MREFWVQARCARGCRSGLRCAFPAQPAFREHFDPSRVAVRTRFSSAGIPMRQLTRLVRYVAPYWWQLLSSLVLMAAVGLLDAFRVLLIGPIFDRVLNPAAQSRDIQLFRLPWTGREIHLQQFVPSHFQNPWTVVAFALIAATVLKGIFD